MKPLLMVAVALAAVTAQGNDCLNPIKNFNDHYIQENKDSSGYPVLKDQLIPFLDKRPLDELRTLAYFLVSYLVEGHSLDDSVIDIRQILMSKPRVKIEGERLIAGHKHATFADVKDRESLSEIVKFLYIQDITNGNLKRTVSNFNDLVDCPTFKLLKY